MPKIAFSAVVLAPLLAASCAEAPPPAAAPPPPSTESSKPDAPAPAEEAKPTDKIPVACADSAAKLCLPPAAFVKRLCAGFYPDVALAMLAKGTPWARGYLQVKSADAWNASGGVSSDDKLVFEEEFILLAHREANTGGMSVSGASGGYDVLRWSGTCATLSGEEVTLRAPPKPVYPKIPWKNLDDKVRDALISDAKIGKVATERRKECKGATMGDVSVKCLKADDMLNTVVVDFLRNGGTVPPPAKLP